MFFLLNFFAARLHALDCAALMNLQMSQARVSQAQTVAAGTFTPPGRALVPAGGAAIQDLPSFCRVAIQATPSPDSNIRIEVWLPAQGWNGRLLATGNGGFAGSISYDGLALGIRQHFATANTDMGTSSSSPVQADGLIGHPEKWKDWGYRATHVMTILAKQVIGAYYGTAPRFSYFRGCSTGGQQGLAEAQRFPEDYDGILSGAPAHARTQLHQAILWNHTVLTKGVAAGLTRTKLALVADAALSFCGTRLSPGGALDIQDPQACRFDPQALLCNNSARAGCLSQAEIHAVKQVYAGPKNARGESIYPGLARGSEAGWDLPSASIPDRQLNSEGKSPASAKPDARPNARPNDEAPYGSIFKWVWGPTWDWRLYNFDGKGSLDGDGARDGGARDGGARDDGARDDGTRMDALLGSTLNATNPDLRAFAQQGHKLLMYHGWADPLIAPAGSIDYFDAVVEAEAQRTRQPNSAALSPTETFLRLFMIRGMEHCGGGTGPSHLDLLPALEAWVETGRAPAELPASRSTAGSIEWAQPLCPYPQLARRVGTQKTSPQSLACTTELRPRPAGHK